MRRFLNLIIDKAQSIATLAAVILFAQIFLVALPQSNQIRKLNTKIQALSKAESASQQALTTLKQLQSMQASGSQDFSRLKLALPNNPELQDIYITIDSMASRTGVSVLSVTPNPSTSGSIPIVLALKGSYESVVEFMNAINRNIRPIDVASVGFAAGVENNNVVLSGSIKLNFFTVPDTSKGKTKENVL